MDNGGHRERQRQRFLSQGLMDFTEERVLELMLFYALPRKDTYPIAKALIQQFGSLVAVMQASPDALMSVPGMGEGAACYLHFIMESYRYYLARVDSDKKLLNTMELCADHMKPHFLGQQKELVCALCLDARCRFMGFKILGEGEVNSANIPIRKIVEFGLNCDATAMVLAHNHPAGIALPSRQDVDSTKKVAAALEAVGITLADHLVFGGGDYTSMAQSGYITSFYSAR